MGKSVKKFRVNVLIDYDKNVNQGHYRPPIRSLLMNLAWLYALDYQVEEDKQDWPDGFEFGDDFYDLVYFRSTDRTPVDGKTFREVIQSVFDQSNLSFLTADVYCMLQKHLKKFPFPANFCRPLNYPFVDVYKEGRKSLHIREEAFLESQHIDAPS